MEPAKAFVINRERTIQIQRKITIIDWKSAGSNQR